MRSLAFATAARNDIRSIINYTAERWGDIQSERYITVLERAFETVRGAPELGAEHLDLRPELRVFNLEHHRVIFRFDDREVTIVRVLHARMDIASSLKRRLRE